MKQGTPARPWATPSRCLTCGLACGPQHGIRVCIAQLAADICSIQVCRFVSASVQHVSISSRGQCVRLGIVFAGEYVKTWRRRWFVLKDGRMFWFLTDNVTPVSREKFCTFNLLPSFSPCLKACFPLFLLQYTGKV